MKIKNKVVALLFLFSAVLITDVEAQNGKYSNDSGLVSVKLSNYLGNKSSVALEVVGDFKVLEDKKLELTPGGYRLLLTKNKAKKYEIELIDSKGVLVKTFDEKFTLEPKIYSITNYVSINGKSYQGTMKFSIENGYIRPVNTLLFEDYLKGVVYMEMPASWGLESLKSQAVAARTYALGKGIGTIMADTQDHQVYGGLEWAKSDYSNKINESVEGTRGVILTNNDKLIEALYSSSNGGYIESNEGAYGTPLLSYLKAKKDNFDPINKFSYQISERVLITKIMPYSKGNKVSKINSITITKKTDGKRTKDVEFNVDTENGTEFTFTMSGIELREALGTMNLQSTYLNTPIKNGEKIIFSGQGFGHGVGMSQYGAKEMAKKGYTYKEILGFYYEEATLTLPSGINEKTTTIISNVGESLDMMMEGAEESKYQGMDGGNEKNTFLLNIKYILNMDGVLKLSFEVGGVTKVNASIYDSNKLVVKKLGEGKQYKGRVFYQDDLSSLNVGSYLLVIKAIDKDGEEIEFSTLINIRSAETLFTLDLIDEKTRIYDYYKDTTESNVALSPQKVEVVKERGDWYMIRTWKGLKWIHLER
jgi:SpoIID/LytB domain protein